MDKKDFHTFSEYMKRDNNVLTASMEDYMEMIYRLSRDNGFTRIHEVSEALNVQPPSATKMVQRLSELELIKYERYGVIMLQDKGELIGKALLKRHYIVEKLLRVLDVSEDGILEETEKIEHTLSNETLIKIEEFIGFIEHNPNIIEDFKRYSGVK